jgi:hypothetical protein
MKIAVFCRAGWQGRPLGRPWPEQAPALQGADAAFRPRVKIRGFPRSRE